MQKVLLIMNDERVITLQKCNKVNKGKFYIQNLILKYGDTFSGSSSWVASEPILNLSTEEVKFFIIDNKEYNALSIEVEMVQQNENSYCFILRLEDKRKIKPVKNNPPTKKYNHAKNNITKNLSKEINNSTPKGFYVYIHRIKGTHTPFYVGKGFGNRYKSTTRNNACNRVWEHNDCEVIVLKDDMSENEALLFESQKIEEFAKKGVILTNILD